MHSRMALTPRFISALLFFFSACAVSSSDELDSQQSSLASFCSGGVSLAAPSCSALDASHQIHICGHDSLALDPEAEASGWILRGDGVRSPKPHTVYKLTQDNTMSFAQSFISEVAIVTKNLSLSVPNATAIYQGPNGCTEGFFTQTSSYFVGAGSELDLRLSIENPEEDGFLLIDPETVVQEVKLDGDCDGTGGASFWIANPEARGCKGSVGTDSAPDPNDADPCTPNISAAPSCAPEQPKDGSESEEESTEEDEHPNQSTYSVCDLNTFPSNCYLRNIDGAARATDARDADASAQPLALACTYDAIAAVGGEYPGLDKGERWRCEQDQTQNRLWWAGPYCEQGYQECPYYQRTTKAVRCWPQNQACPE